jgi:hypothetical protein
MVSNEHTELCAERLRVAITALSAADDFGVGRYPAAAPLLHEHDMALLRTSSDEDQQLAQACLDAEHDMRRREWGGAEQALARGWFLDWQPFCKAGA